MQISIEMFRNWQKDEVTTALFRHLAEKEAEICSYMQHPDVVMADNAIRHLTRMVGQRDMLDYVLNLDITSLEETDNEDTPNSP